MSDKTHTHDNPNTDGGVLLQPDCSEEFPFDPKNCPNCGCGFIVRYDNGTRICLYCPHRWHIKQNTEGEDEVRRN